MKNTHPFYLVTFLLSLSSVIFCSHNRITSTIQKNQERKLQVQRSLEKKSDWEQSLQNIESLNKYAKNNSSYTSNQHEQNDIATIFPRIYNMGMQHQNKRHNSPVQTHEPSNLPDINNTPNSSSQSKTRRDRVNTEYTNAINKMNNSTLLTMNALNELDAQLFESAAAISNTPSHDLFTLTEETTEDNLLIRKNKQRLVKKIHQKQMLFSKDDKGLNS
ncbi:MAG: hypothetical protein Q8Q60_01185 [Candidatus Chromulinivorax sp.]|nr:hypothetical protein [Candidatus Chromulinivorax sp.]